MATWGDLNTVQGPQSTGGMFSRITTPPKAPAPPSPSFLLYQMARQKALSQPTAQTSNYKLPYAPSNTDQYWKHDLWENIQNETRKPQWSDMAEPNFNMGQRIDAREVDPALMQQLGLRTEIIGDTETGPMGESGISEKIAGGEFLDNESAMKYANYRIQHQMDRPSSKQFGADWRRITEADKYKVLDPRAVVWDDNLGWITHKKNYNPDGDKSWFQRNAGSILPAAMGMLIGGPAGMAIGLGTSAVNAAVGKTSWQSLLPTLLTAGLSGAGMLPSGLVGNLLRSGLRFGTGQLFNRRG